MKKNIRKIAAVLLSAVMLFGMMTVVPFTASAAENEPQLTVYFKSNFFPEVTNTYYDLSEFEDENGDVFITMECKMCAMNKYLINLDVDELTWNPDVLEFKESYNMSGTGRRAILNLFPFAVSQGRGAGMLNTFGDDNGGRIVGNYTNVSPAAYAYEEDGSAITVVKAVFKVLDKNAGETTISCIMDTLSLDDDTDPEPRSKYVPVDRLIVNPDCYYDIATYETVLSPASQAPDAVVGDISGDGEVAINDVTILQRFLSEFDDVCESFDISDPAVFKRFDVNRDGHVDVRDITHLQRYLAMIITEL